MKPEDARKAWRDWVAFNEPPQAVVEALDDSLQHPDENWDALYHDVIRDFDEESDFFWIDYAIKYASRATDKAQAAADLERILGNPTKYAVLGGLFGSAASYLGLIAAYPNETLSTLMQAPDTGNEEIDDVLEFARPAAFGAYITTATEFDYGMQVGREMKASRKRPTREQAEVLIQKWRAQNGPDSASPSHV